MAVRSSLFQAHTVDIDENSSENIYLIFEIILKWLNNKYIHERNKINKKSKDSKTLKD